MSQESLLQDIENVITVYEQEIGPLASRTRNTIKQYGSIESLSRLAVSTELQSGFKMLRDRNKLDMTFESLLVRHAELFRDDVVDAAHWRLDNLHLLL